MSTELIEIDPSVLLDLLKKRGLSRYDLAQRLQISTKTIQRWLNHSVRRVKMETLIKLAIALETTPEELRKDSPSVTVRTTDRAVEEICADYFIERVRLTDDWVNYLTLLKSVHAGQLSSEQRLLLFKNIGISSYFVGKFRASRMYLGQALELAEAFDAVDLKIEIASWSARRAETMGNFELAHHYIEQIDQLEPQINCARALSEHYYVKAKIYHHLEDYDKSLSLLRQGILNSYQEKSFCNALIISIKYLQMGHTYLRMKKFAQARIAFSRLIKSAERAGWVRGTIYGHYYLGLIGFFMSESPTHFCQFFGKARKLRQHAEGLRFCPIASQAEFLYHISSHRYVESKNLLLKRLQKTRNSHLYFAYAVLDGLYLSKLQPQIFNLRPSYIEKARDYFRKHGLKTPLKMLEALLEKQTLTTKEFIEIYMF